MPTEPWYDRDWKLNRMCDVLLVFYLYDQIPLPTPERRRPPATFLIKDGSRCTHLSIRSSTPGRSRLSMKWLDAPQSAVMVKLTLLVVEEEAMEEYPMP